MSDLELMTKVLGFVMAPAKALPVAKDLARRHKTLYDACLREEKELTQIAGMGPKTAAFLRSLPEVARAFQRRTLKEAPLLTISESLVAYARLILTPPTVEHCLVFYCDQHQRLIHEECHQVGTLNEVTIYPREIVRSALNCNAAALLLMHNHPQGNPYPSNKDLIMTRKMRDMLAVFEVTLLDHLILGKDDTYSILGERLIKSTEI